MRLLPLAATLSLAAAAALSLAAAGAAGAQEIRRFSIPDFPISASVEVPAGSRLVYVSGTVPEAVDPSAPEGSVARYGDTATQTRSVLQRLAQLLITLCDLDGADTTGGIVIDRVLTHEELANLVGATRQWVTASLDRFQKQTLLRIENRRIVVLDRDRLERIADC